MSIADRLLSRHECDQLLSIAGCTGPYWWGRATMPKLAARGYVEPYPGYPKAWRITKEGADFASTLQVRA